MHALTSSQFIPLSKNRRKTLFFSYIHVKVYISIPVHPTSSHFIRNAAKSTQNHIPTKVYISSHFIPGGRGALFFWVDRRRRTIRFPDLLMD